MEHTKRQDWTKVDGCSDGRTRQKNDPEGESDKPSNGAEPVS
jgi:hypothetical protein